MAKTILAKHFLRLCALLFSLLLSIFLTMTPVYANSGSDGDKKEMIARHMETMRQKFPEIDEKVREIEEKLRSGIMSPTDACSNCHIRGDSKPTGR